MVLPLLTTKLHVPPALSGLVSRPRLLARLDEGLSRGRRLTLVSAPAGFGKTTLVVEWLAGSGRPTAWLSLDEADNDPVQFLTYLIAAIQRVDPVLGRTAQELLRSPQAPPVQALLTSLVNDVASDPNPLALVLDDYQLVTAPEVHQVLRFLLEHRPSQLHVVVCTREDPPFPLPQLRARGQLTEIRQRDLRFDVNEAAQFLEGTMGLGISPSAIAALEARTEGWVAGLQLAALALQEETIDPESFVASFAGNDRYVMDYLVAEVLERQPESVREFLRNTSILEELTAPLCAALTGRDDSQAMLERLQAANLFLVPLDNRREWFRYHRLFAEVLRTGLEAEDRRDLHGRAARWYEERGLFGPAIRHSFLGASDGDYESPERLIKRTAGEAILAGGVATLRGWLDSLPDERVRTDAELATYKGWVFAISGDLVRAAEYADLAEVHTGSARSERTIPGKLALLRSVIAIGKGDYEGTTELAGRALASLDPDETQWRVMALWSLAEAQERSRGIDEAIRSLREARQPSRALGNHVFAVLIEASLAADLNLHGHRREAVEIGEAVIAQYEENPGQHSPIAGLIFSRLGLLSYEANELSAARGYAEKGLALSEQIPLGSPLSFSLGASAMVFAAEGNAEEAIRELRRGYALALQEALADASWLRALEASIQVRRGDLVAARSLVDGVDEAPSFLRIEAQLALCRVRLAEGEIGDASQLLERLERFTRERELFRWLLSVQVLRSLAAEKSGERAAARGYLAEAVRLAAPESYFRAFLDEDSRVIDLLPDVRQEAPVFVARLLDYGGVANALPASDAQRLPEPLSERELEVLALIAGGHSNAQIADRLFIAPGTVKRHINNLYGKLGVASRTQAMVKARALRLG